MPKAVDHLPRQALAVRHHADIGHERRSLAAGGLDLGHHRLGAVPPGVADHRDGGTLPPVAPRDAGADPARAAGHDRNLPFELHGAPSLVAAPILARTMVRCTARAARASIAS